MSQDNKVLCKCNHEFQDKQYGKQVRVANPRAGKRADGSYEVRCTVCGTIHIKGSK